MTLLQQAGAAVLLLAVTLSLQCGGAAALILWIRGIPRGVKKCRCSLRRARHANHGGCHHSARNRHSAVGELLPVALPAILGIRVLLFGEQLCDSWIRGCGPSVEVAPVGPLESMVGMLMSGVSMDFSSRGHSPGRRRVAVPFTTSHRAHECG